MNDTAPYKPDIFEIYGRKMKIEYLGMASVYTIIALYFFGGLPSLTLSILATIGAFFLFLGLKKKTKDHLSGSLILFAAVAVGCGPVKDTGWIIPYILFGFSVFAMEGYLEKRQYRIYLLPFLFFFWALKDPTWLLGFIFAAIYLTHPWSEKPGLRRRLLWIILISLALGAITSFVQSERITSYGMWPVFQGQAHLDALPFSIFVLLVPCVVLCLLFFWGKILLPNKFNTLLFCALSPFDGRLTALFAMVAAVLMSATIFRKSIAFDGVRPAFKHGEWYYFWVVFAGALYLLFNRLPM